MSLDSAMSKFGPGGGGGDATASEAASEPETSAGSVPSPGDDGSGAVSGAEAVAAPASEAAPVEDTKALAREISAEKLALIKQKRAERQARAEAQKALDEARREREALEAEKAQLRELRKDYRKLPEVLGVSALDVFDEMARQASEAGTPEAHIKSLQERLPDLIRAEIEPIKAENEALKAQLAELAAEREAIRQERQLAEAKQQMVSIFESPDFEDLRAEYTIEYLVQSANTLGQLWQQKGEQYTLRDLAVALKHANIEQQRHRPTRVAQGAASPPAAPAQPATVNGAAVQNAAVVTNNLASGSEGAPRLTRKERISRLSRGG